MIVLIDKQTYLKNFLLFTVRQLKPRKDSKFDVFDST